MLLYDITLCIDHLDLIKNEKHALNFFDTSNTNAGGFTSNTNRMQIDKIEIALDDYLLHLDEIELRLTNIEIYLEGIENDNI